MFDWLGNELVLGNLVVYSSTSTLTGMNLAEITALSPGKIQLRLWAITRRSSGATYMPSRLITLTKGSSAYRSVTKYSGNLPDLQVKS